MTQIFTGSKYHQNSLLIETLEDRILYDAAPVVTIDTESSVGIGETLDVTVIFENGDDTDTGYGPWIDVAIKTTGSDGIADPDDPSNPHIGDTDGDANPGDQYDGFTLITPPSFLGQNLNYTLITLDDGANEGMGVLHPYAVDINGNNVYIHTGTGPFSDLLQGFQTGDQLLVIELPFGSYTPGQPGAEVTFSLELSNYADVGVQLPIAAQGGFRYGNDPLDNPTPGPSNGGNGDPSIIGGAHVAHTEVDATLATLTKEYIGPEGETATGPNYLRTYRITVDIAEGQTLSDLNIFDQLSDQVQFVGISGSSHAYTVHGQPDTTIPGGDLHLSFNDSIVGTASTSDVWIEIQFYVPRLDANGQEVIPEESGAFINIENQAYGYGTWTPEDPRDDAVRLGLNVDVDPDPLNSANPDLNSIGGPENVLEAQSIAVQKNVEIIVDNGMTGVTPGDVLEYTIDFQVSDYFAFGNIVITDWFSDGQEFLDLFVPVLSINGNTFVLTGADFDLSNFIVSDPHPETGVTVVTFNVSAELIRRALEENLSDEAKAGLLLGGGIDPEDPTWAMTNGLDGPGDYNDGPTTGRIIFRTLILDEFRAAHNQGGQSGEAALNPRDVLTNDVEITGEVLDLEGGFAGTGNFVVDNSQQQLEIAHGDISKEIYAINGVLTTDPQFNALFRTGGNPNGTVNISPGDTVTYRLVYTVPSGDVEQFRFADYLPLPVFDAGELSTFDPTLNDDPPAAGTFKYGPVHTLNDVNGDYMLDENGDPMGQPRLTVNSGNNSFEIYLGTTHDTDNEFRRIDILFTVTVNSDPFADGMYLTNQALSGERSTQQPATEANALAIIQIVLGQPVVEIYKGVVSSTQQGGVEDVGGAGGVTFADIGAGSFTGTVSGQTVAEAIGELDLLSGQLPDSGDIIRYALVVQNTGRSDAYDVTFQDTIRGSYVNDYADASAFRSGTNFRVYTGAGEELVYGDDYTLSWDNVTKEFQVQLVDQPDAGMLGRGFDASNDAVVTNGSNAIVVLYDLQVDLDAQASSTVLNTAELTHYAGETGGANHLEAGTRSDDAQVLLASPTLVKQVVGTSHNVPGNNDSQAVIGEVITWQVTITVPEGTTDGVRLVDILDPGLGYLDTVSITYSPGVSSSLNPGGPTVGNVNGGTDNQLTYDFGTITNTNTNNGVAETITITYQTVVLNTNNVPSAPGNQAGTELDNSATLEWEWIDDPSGTGGSETITVSGDSVEVVEPALSVEKVVSGDGSTWVETLTGVDAGDEVYYQIVISNLAAGTTHAYNTRLQDQLPAHLVGATIESVSGGGLNSGDFQITGSMVLENVNPNGFTLEQGQTVTIIVRGTLGYDVNPDELITNSAAITWTSLPDDEVIPGFGERTGEGGEGSDSAVLNNYADSDGANIRITNPAPIKSVISTSEDHTTGTDVAIGEVVRYRIVLRVVEGTTENLVIQDNLPAGMQYLGNAKIAFVSLGDNLSSSPVGLGGAYVNGSSGNVVPTFDIPAGLVIDADGGGTFLNGEGVLFNLGTIINTANNSEHEYIVIEFNALVLNVSGNQQGTTLNNTVTVTQNGDTLHEDVSGVEVTVVEPTLTVSKAVNSDISDAGDPISYTITISNTSGVDAFNVTLEDILPGAFHLLPGASSIEDLITSLTGPAGVTLANFELTSYDNNTTRTLQTTAGGFTLRDGESVTLTLSGVVSGSVSPNEIIENEVDIEWTSLPGEGTSGNPTGSDTPGDSGDEDGERTGSGGVNDYSDSSEVASTAVNEITVTKHYHRSNDAGTSDANQQVTIGEIVTYAIYIDLPEGTVVEDGLVITDFVPVGMQYVGHQLVTSAAGSADWNSNFRLSADFNGIVNPAEIDVSYVIGGDLTFTFGEIVIFAENPSDPGALLNNAFVLLIDMQVLNVVGNQAGDALVNEAEWSVSPDPANPEASENTNTVTVTIVEPELEVEKELLTPGDSFDEGDVVEYQITVTAAGGVHNSQANQVRIQDLIPPELTLDLGSIQITLNDALGATNSSAGNQLEFLIDSINPDGSVVITFSATVNIAIAGSTITNEVDIDWTSLISTTESEERTGGGVGPNDYADNDSEDFLISVPSIIKSVIDTSEDYTSGTDVTIGEIITYEIVVTIPEGVTEDLIITDLVQANAAGVLEIQSLVLHSWSADLSWTGTPQVTYSDLQLGDGLDDQVEIDFGNVTNSNTDNGVAETIVIRVTARVVNVGANQNGDVLSNEANLAYTDGTEGATTLTTGPVDVTVVEPELQIEKEFKEDVSNLDAGDTVTYLITISHTGSSSADAFDLIIRDELPSELENYRDLNARVVDETGMITTNVNARFMIDGNGVLMMSDAAGNPLNLKKGESLIIEVSATVPDDTLVGTTIHNEATLLWTSLEDGLRGDQNGTVGERTGTGGGANDYADDDAVEVKTRGALAVSKSSDMSTATIGETVTYSLEITVAEGRTVINLLDDLPDGVTLLSSGFSVSDNAANLLFNFDDVDFDIAAGLISGQLIVWSNGGTANNGATAHDVTFTLTYEVRVDNVSGNVGLDDGAGSQTDLENEVSVSSDLDQDGNIDPDETSEDEVTVTVVEPQLEIEKTITSSVTNLDAGDTVTYQIRISHSDESTSNAYELILSDQLPAELRDYVLVSAWIGGTDVSGSLSLNTTTGLLTTSGDIDLAVGSELVITLSGIVKDDTLVGTTIDNEALLLWSSMDGGLTGEDDGDEDTERTGRGGGANNYEDEDAVSAQTRGALAVSKSSDMSTATIGETVTYSLEITVAEGRTIINLLDNLPDGVTLLSTGFSVSDNAANLLFNFDDVDFDIAAGLISGQLIVTSNGGTANGGGTGHDVTFTLTYEVRVDNIADNSGDSADQTELENTVTVSSDLDQDGNIDPDETSEDEVTVTVVEPRLEVTKEIISNTTELDAGDTLTYRITIGHTGASTSDAFDLIISDELSEALRDHQLLGANIVVGATSTNVIGLLSIVNGTLVVTDPEGNPLDLKLGESLVIEVSGIVKDDTLVGTVIDNEVLLLWTSMEEGLRGDEAGDTDTERTGVSSDPTDPDDPNTYHDQDDVSAKTRGALAVTKSSDKNEATIGEIVTYTIEITVAEGQTVVNLEDHLPAGMTFLEDLHIGANSAGLLITGLLSDSLTQTLTVTSNGGTLNNGNTAHNVSFTLVYTARVDNVSDNVGLDDGAGSQTDLENEVVVSSDLDQDGNIDPDETSEDEVTVTVVEPQLEIEKTITSSVTNLDAGDTVTYQIRISHSDESTSNAYELILSDQLPAELRDYVLVSAWIGGTDVSGSLSLNTTTGLLTTSGDIDLAVGSELVITLSGIVKDDTLVGTTIDNEALLLWSSMDGGLTGEDDGDEDTERTGRGGGANNYEDDDAVSAKTRGALAVVKSSDMSTATIGETVTYSLEITVAEGRTIINLLDDLPDGVTLLSSGFGLGAGTSGLLFDFDDVIFDVATGEIRGHFEVTSNGGTANGGGTAHDVTFTLTYEVRVDNIGANVGLDDGAGSQTDLENEVTVSADLDQDGNIDPEETFEDEVTVTVVEPQLEIEKTITSSVTNLDAGDTVTYQIVIRHTEESTADAFDLILSDPLPGDLRNYNLSSATIGLMDVSGLLSIDSNGNLIVTDPAGNSLHLALGEELVITLSGIVKEDTLVGTTIRNEAILLWSSLEGGKQGDEAGDITERTGVAEDPLDPNDPNNYTDQSEVEAQTRGALAVSKSSDAANATIGDIVTYTLTITVAEGRTIIDLLDELPEGMTYIGGLTEGLNAANLDIDLSGVTVDLLTNRISGTLIVTSTGSSLNDGSEAQDAVFTLVYTARVDNVSDNVGLNDGSGTSQTELKNTVTVSSDLDQDASTDDDTDTDEVTVTVVEPQLEIEKTITSSVTNLDAGDTVTYQIVIRHTEESTADAFDLILSDPLPGDLRNYNLSSATIGVTSVSGLLEIVGDDVNGYSLVVTDPAGNPLHLALGEELVITLSGIVKDDTLVGTTIRNEAILLWSSLDGGKSGDEDGDITERTGVAEDPLDPNDPNNYTDQSEAEAKTRGALAVVKSSDMSTATIGETVTYSLEITVAEGRTIINLLDDLPDGVTLLSSGFGLGAGTSGLLFDFDDVIFDVASGEIRGHFEVTSNGGTADNGGTAHDVTFTLTYEVRVDNIGDNVGLNDGSGTSQTDLENEVAVSSDLDQDGNIDPDETSEDEVTVTVVEPQLEIEKTITSSVTNLDAGDTVTYQIRISHTDESTSNAYELILSDQLPAELRDYVLVSAWIGGTDVSGSLSLNTTTGLLTTSGDIDLAVGSELVITLSGIVKDDTLVGTTIDNEALLLWSSMDGGLTGEDDGDEDTERTGRGGGANNYEDDDAVSAKTRGALAVVKSSDMSTATIGETVTYSLEITVAEGRTIINLLDDLPDGVTLLSSGFGLGAGTSGLLFDFDDVIFDVATGEIRGHFEVTSNGGAANNGGTAHDVTFTLTYEVRVDNIGANSGDSADQTDLDNTVTVSSDLDQDGNIDPDETSEDEVTVTVVEPRLEVTKEIISNITELDAGDTLTYRITVGHTAASTSDAFDLIISDDLPDALRNHELLSANIVVGATSTNVIGLLSIVNGTLVVTDPAGNPLNLKLGESLVIEVSGIVKDDTRVGTIIENEVLLLWTSLEDGLRGDEAGDTDTERTGVAGDPNDPDDPNTYRDEDEDSAQTRGALGVTKSADKSEATIGEIVTYTIEITVAEGQTIVNLEDHLPTGLTFLEDLQIGGNLSGLLITGLQSNSLTQTLTVTSNGGTSNNGSTGHDVSFTLVYTARVDNIADNSGDIADQTTLTNEVEVSADLDNDINTPDDVDEDEVTVTVVEPQLQIEKTISSDVSELDAGDTVEYQIRISHTGSSTSNAYELILNDSMPAELRNYQLVSAWIGGVDVSGALTLNTTTGVLSTTGDIDLELGSELVITLRGIVRDDTTVGTTINNEAILLWSSHDGGLSGDDVGSTNTERTGVAADPNDPNDPNTYNDQDDVEATTRGALAVAKSADKSEATIGEIVTYTIEITVAEGRTVVDLLDLLPAGLTFIENSMQIGSNSANLTINGLNINSLSQSLEILTNYAGGTVGNDGSTAQNVSFTLTYQARVDNIADNSGDSANQTNLENRVEVEADLDNDGTTGGPGERQEDTADIDVVEPRLEVTKEIISNTTELDAGDTLTYRITVGHTAASTSDAFDLIISDDLPDALRNHELLSANIVVGATSTNVVGLLSIVNGTLVVTDPAGNALNLKLGESLVIEVSGIVKDDTRVGTIIENEVLLLWTSLEDGLRGDEAGDTDTERTGVAGDSNDPDDPNTYRDEDEDSAQTRGALGVTKSADKSEATIGEIVTYTIEITVAEGQTIVNLEDHLPTGLTFLEDLQIGSNLSGLLITGLQSNSLTQTLTVTSNGGTVNNGSTGHDVSFTLVYTARVDNIADNSGDSANQTNLENRVEVEADLDNDGTTGGPGERQEDTADIDVVEPRLEVIKEIISDTDELDAGDTLTYRITIGHTAASTSDAFDLIISDELSEALRDHQLLSANIVVGATSSNVTGLLSIINGTLVVTDPAGNPLNLKLGESLVIEVRGIVKDDTLVGTVIDNEVLLLWTSMEEGLRGNEAGDTDTERTGVSSDPTDPDDPNTYHDQDDVSAKTRGALAVTKSSDKDEATIGEIVTYTIEITVAEGQTVVNLEDHLPAGMTFLEDLHIGTNAAGLLIAGLQVDSLTQTLTITSNGGTSNDGSTGHDISFTLVYTARVDNVSGNIGDSGNQTTLDNEVDVSADLDNDSTTPDDTDQDGVRVTVVEPKLQIEKTISNDVSELDAGDTVEYQIRISHTALSTSNAYELILNDSMPVELRNYELVSAWIGLTDVSGALALNTTTGVLSTIGDIDLELGSELVITLRGIVRDDTTVGTTIQNEAILLWSSHDGGLSGDDVGSVNTERTGVAADPTDQDDPNTYNDQDDVEATTRGALAVAKSADKSEATIGEIVTYTIEITVAEGRTVVDLLDTLPPGLTFIANSLQISSNNANLIINGLDANSLSQSLEILANSISGTVGNDGSIAQNVSFTLTYQAIVDNVIGNSGDSADQTNLENIVVAEADLDLDGNTNGSGERQEDTADIDVVEPRLEVVKTASKQDPHLGETITYTIVVSHTGSSTSDAYDLVITDLIPADKLIQLGNFTITPSGNSNAVLESSSLTGWTIRVDHLELGETITITYEATITETPTDVLGDDGLFGTVDSSDDFTNTADVTWSSLSGSVTGERDGSGDPLDPNDPNNYNHEDDETVTVVGADLALVKDDGITTVQPGDVWNYTITITNNGTDAATGVIVTDVLHPELIFKSATLGGTYDAATRTVTWNLADIAVGDTVTIEVEVELIAVVSAGLESLTNTAMVTHDDIDPTSNDVPNPPYNDNEDPDTNVIDALPDLVVMKTEVLTNGEARNNTLLQYEITVTNVGNQDASDVILTDDFDQFLLSFISTSHNGVFDGDLIVWDLGTIRGGGGSVTIVVEARVYGPVPQHVEEVTNTAWATFDEDLSGKDPTPENNTDEHTIHLKVAPDMVVVKSTAVDELGVNEILLYTIEVSNAGPQNATHVVVVDNLPSEFVFISASHGGVYDAATHTVTWNSSTTPQFGVVLGQGQQKITLELRVQLATGVAVVGDVTNVVRVTDDGTNGPDENPSNNEDDETVRVVGFTYDSFNNFSRTGFGSTVSSGSWGGFEGGWTGKREFDWILYPIETHADPILPLAPIYSGAAEAGSTLVIVLYNAKGEEIGRQSVVVDSGGNWMATFPGAVVKDHPQSVQISQTRSSVQTDDNHGYNLRPYYATALNAGHFFSENMTVTRVNSMAATVVTGALYESVANPIGFDIGKHAYEFITIPGHPTGY